MVFIDGAENPFEVDERLTEPAEELQSVCPDHEMTVTVIDAVEWVRSPSDERVSDMIEAAERSLHGVAEQPRRIRETMDGLEDGSLVVIESLDRRRLVENSARDTVTACPPRQTHLESPASAAALAAQADIYGSTVYRLLSPLKNRGIVSQHDGEYALNDEFEGLVTLARAFVHHKHRQWVEDHVDPYTIL